MDGVPPIDAGTSSFCDALRLGPLSIVPSLLLQLHSILSLKGPMYDFSYIRLGRRVKGVVTATASLIVMSYPTDRDRQG